jgi:hypothetical protein
MDREMQGIQKYTPKGAVLGDMGTLAENSSLGSQLRELVGSWDSGQEPMHWDRLPSPVEVKGWRSAHCRLGEPCRGRWGGEKPSSPSAQWGRGYFQRE